MLISYPLPNPRPNSFESLARAMCDSAKAFDRAVEAVAVLTRRMHQYVALHGSGRIRKPYVKQTGVQFGRFANGRLTQYKRLANGVVVKV